MKLLKAKRINKEEFAKKLNSYVNAVTGSKNKLSSGNAASGFSGRGVCLT